MAIKTPKKNGKNNGNAAIKSVHRLINESFSWKCVIAFSMGLILSIMLYPQILQMAPPEYKVRSIITKDIQADRDFLVVDRAATEQKRVEAVENTRPVYDYDSDMPAKIETAISKAFLDMEKNAKEKSESPDNGKLSAEKAKKIFEDVSGITLTASEFKALNKKGFSLELCGDIVKLVYCIYGDRLIGNRDILSLHKNKGITIRDIENQEESDLDDLSSILDTGKMNSIIRKNAKVIFKTKK
ncbi:MAG: hypothetical protein KAT81_07145, partial [Syntrophobacterales bacterium]|nr:hypothetical protein [Syntrophobacterales bacterium]